MQAYTIKMSVYLSVYYTDKSWADSLLLYNQTFQEKI